MGPLQGLRVIELAGIGPCPMCAMLLAELGADVVRVDRLADSGLGIGMAPEYHLLNRSRPSIAVDLKHPTASRRCFASSTAPTRLSRDSGPASPSVSASVRKIARPEIRGWSTAG